MRNPKRAVKQSGCEHCGPIKTLLRLVVIDGWPRTVTWPGADSPHDYETNLFYCAQCRLLAAKSEEEARQVLGLHRHRGPAK